MAVSLTANLTSAVQTTDPTYCGVCSSQYGASPATSSAQAQSEQSLDARYWRIPVKWNGTQIVSSAAGTGSTQDVLPVIQLYLSWGHRVILVVAGRTDDYNGYVAGDAAAIVSLLVSNGVDLAKVDISGPNEINNMGFTVTDFVTRATTIYNEIQTPAPGKKVFGPVWSWYERTALQQYADGMTSTRFGGIDYHNYAMGGSGTYDVPSVILSRTPDWGTQIAEVRSDLAARGLQQVVNIDEVNYSWAYNVSPHGNVTEFFQAENTLWQASVHGHVLRNGGRAMTYATQNGPLGVMVEAGNNDQGRPGSSPMPAYWGIAAWTGGGAPGGSRLFSHFKDTFYATTTSDSMVECFAVNNEASGYNVVVLNKSDTSQSTTLNLTGLPVGWRYDLWQTVRANPYDTPVKLQSAISASSSVTFTAPAMTWTVLTFAAATAASSTLTDTFDSTSLAPKWNGESPGIAGIANGRAWLSCSHVNGTPNWYIIFSNGTYTFDAFSAQIFPAAANGAGAGATVTTELELNSQTSGTRLSFLIDTVNLQLRAYNQVGGTDLGMVSVAYNATNHAYLRMRLSGGALLYETAPDGRTWTVLRTVNPAPAWLTAEAVVPTLRTVRNGGTNNNAEFDNVNIAPVTSSTGAMGFNWPNTVVTFVNQWDQQTTTYANRAHPFAVAQANGAQVMRTFFGTYDSFQQVNSGVQATRDTAWARLKEILDTASAYGVKLVLSNYLTQDSIGQLAGTTYASLTAARQALITPGSAAYNGLQSWMSQALSRFANHPGVYSWEVVNEPGWMLGIDDGTITRDQGVTFLDTFQLYLKNNGAGKVNAGGRPLYDKSLLTDAQVITATQNVDMLDDHFYSDSATAASHLAAMDTWVARVNTLLGRTMPVMVGEYGTDTPFFDDITDGAMSRGWLALAWAWDAWDANEFNDSTRTYVIAKMNAVNAVPPPGGGTTGTVQFRSASQDDRGTAGVCAPDLPTGTTSGDLLLAVQTSDYRGTLSAMTAPAGWTMIGSSSARSGDVGFVKVWQRVATSSEVTPYSFPDSASSTSDVVIVAVSGYDTTQPLYVTPTWSSGPAQTTHAAPSVAALNGDLLVTAHIAGTNGTTRSYTGAPSGMTLARATTIPTGGYVLLGVYYKAITVDGATGAEIATCSASTPFMAMSLVVQPAHDQSVMPIGIASAQAFGSPTVTVAAGDQTVTAAGISSGEAFGVPVVTGDVAAGDQVVVPIGIVAVGDNAGYVTPGAGLAPAGFSTLGVGEYAAAQFGVPTLTGGPIVYPVGIATAEVFGSPTVTVAAAQSTSAFGMSPFGTAPFGASVGTGPYPSALLYPGSTTYPGLPASTPVDQSVTAIGITSAEALGSPVVTVAAGAQTVVTTAIDPAEAFGVPTVTVAAGDLTITPDGIASAEAFGRAFVFVEVIPPVPTGVDSYYVDGVDLTSYAWRIETAEGLQVTPGVIGEDVILPGRDGAIEVFGGFGQQRRPDAIGKIVFSLWLKGVDPSTGLIPGGSSTAEEYFARWDALVKLFHRRRVTIDHVTAAGVTRRATGHLIPGDSITPARVPSSPWFGRFKATFAIPAAHWTDTDTVTTGQQSLATGGTLDLSAFDGATAPCTELTVTFGAGNNPRLSTAWGFVGWNDVIASGRQLSIDTATGTTGQGSGTAWTPGYGPLTFSPGPRLFEIDPSEALTATLTHTGGGTMTVQVTGKRRYRTS